MDASDTLSTIAAASVGLAFNPWLFWAIATGHVVNIGLQTYNTLQPVADTAPGLYIAGLLWYLVHGAVQFSRILIVQPGSS